MIVTIDELDTLGRKIINRLKHDEGSPKGKTWCDGYHEGLVDMLVELKKEFQKDLEDYQSYCDSMFETNDKPLPYSEWKSLDKEKHNES